MKSCERRTGRPMGSTRNIGSQSPTTTVAGDHDVR